MYDVGEDPLEIFLVSGGKAKVRAGEKRGALLQAECVCVGGGGEGAIISATAAGVGYGGGVRGWEGPAGATVHCCLSLTCEVER